MKIFLITMLLGLATNSYAGDSSSGCGLGWAIFKDTSLVSSTFRTTTNVFFLNTIGMTLGTSGCAKHSIVNNESKGIHFAEANYHQLLVEMSAGRGEYLDAFTNVLGCSDSSAFKSFGQKNYGKIFKEKTSNGIEMFDNLKREAQVGHITCKLI